MLPSASLASNSFANSSAGIGRFKFVGQRRMVAGIRYRDHGQRHGCQGHQGENRV